MSQHVVGSRLTSNIKITLKIKFTSQIFADISRSLVVVLQHLRFCKKILILIFFSDLFSIECKFFCPNSADNTMENRAISLVESSRDNSLISCPTSSAIAPCSPGNMGWNIVKRNAGSLIDDVRHDIAINFMLTWHKLSFLIGQFEFEV